MRPLPHTPAGPVVTRVSPTCDDCYFRRQGLCALMLERPCPTFRADGRRLQPPRQARLVARPPVGAPA